jgi:hypothetical protein
MPWSSRAVMALLVAFAKRLARDGYLALDDVIVEKAFAKRLAWASWVYSFAKKPKVWGLDAYSDEQRDIWEAIARQHQVDPECRPRYTG